MPAGVAVRVHARIERRHTKIDEAEADDLLNRQPTGRQMPVVEVDRSPADTDVDWSLKMVAALERAAAREPDEFPAEERVIGTGWRDRISVRRHLQADTVLLPFDGTQPLLEGQLDLPKP